MSNMRAERIPFLYDSSTLLVIEKLSTNTCRIIFFFFNARRESIALN